MGVTTRMAERRARVVNPLHPRDPGLISLFGLGDRTKAGQRVDTETALTQSAWNRGVRYLCETFASLPLQVFQHTASGREMHRDHELYARLHDQPNRYQTSFEWREMAMSHLVHRGNAYSRKAPSRLFPPYELETLHPDRVTPFWAPNGEIAYAYRPSKPLSNGRTEEVILGAEMLHIRFMPKDGLRGRGVLEYAREAIGLALAQEEHQARVHGEGEKPGGVITVQKALSPEAMERFIKRWRERRQGNNPAWALLEEGMDAKELGLSPEDLESVEAGKFQVVQVARFLGVLPTKLYASESVAYNGMEHENLASTIDTIRPWAVRWEQAMLRDLFRLDWPGYYAEFNLDGLMRGNYKERQEGRQIQRQNGIINADEWRAGENMNPQEGGQGKTYIVPLNMIDAASLTTGSAGPADDRPVTEPGAEEKVQDLALNGAQIASLLTIIQQVTSKQIAPATATQLIRVAFPSLTDAAIEELVNSAEAFVPALQDASERANRDRHAERRSRAALALTRLRKAYAPAFQDAAAKVLRRESQEVSKHFKQMAGTRSLADFTDWLPGFYADHQGIVERQMLPVMVAYAGAVRDLTAPLAGGDADQIDLTAFVATYAAAYAARHVGRSRSRISQTLTDTPEQDLMSAMVSLLDGWPEERAASIASAEVVREGTAVARETWRASGVRELVWVKSGSSCGLCDSLHGQVVGIEREFVFAGETVDGVDQAPLVARKTLHPPLHDGCDCSIAPA